MVVVVWDKQQSEHSGGGSFGRTQRENQSHMEGRRLIQMYFNWTVHERNASRLAGTAGRYTV